MQHIPNVSGDIRSLPFSERQSAYLATDEAQRCGVCEAELVEIGSFWGSDEDEISNQAESLGLFDQKRGDG